MNTKDYIMKTCKGFLATLLKQLRRLTPVFLFTIYFSIGLAHLLEVYNPRLMGGLHTAAAFAHLL
jgi:hypothetical protein